jgi:hypothetical protein
LFLCFFLVINSTPVSFVLFGVSRYASSVVVLVVLGASLHIAAYRGPSSSRVLFWNLYPGVHWVSSLFPTSLLLRFVRLRRSGEVLVTTVLSYALA